MQAEFDDLYSSSNLRAWKVNSVTSNEIEIELDFYDKLAIKPGDYCVTVIKFMEFKDHKGIKFS